MQPALHLAFVPMDRSRVGLLNLLQTESWHPDKLSKHAWHADCCSLAVLHSQSSHCACLVPHYT